MIDPQRYAHLLSSSEGDISPVLKGLARRNPHYADSMVQAMFDQPAEDKTIDAVRARGSLVSPLWTNSITALAGLYYLSAGSKTAAAFNAILGPRTVATELSATAQNKMLVCEATFGSIMQPALATTLLIESSRIMTISPRAA